MVLGVLIVLSGVAIAVRFFRVSSGLIGNASVENPSNNSVNSTANAQSESANPFAFLPTPEANKAKAPVKTATNQYSGQALKFLGDPQILAGYPAEFVERKRNQLADIVKLIESDPKDETNWMDAGLIKKNFDNFDGVRDVWEYAKLVNPNNALNYYNLGILYASYFSDNKKAEQNFLVALKLDPQENLAYLGLAGLYRDFYKEKSDQVDDVLLAGLKVLPEDPNLLLQLGFYYKSVQDKERAIEYFNRFLKLVGITGYQQQQIQNEVDILSR